jgi:hypothetical protein
MNAMKEQCMLAVAILLAGCGSGSDSGDVSVVETDGPDGPARYTTSQPLLDNSSASAYKVLLMGNSHAAGLNSVLPDLLALGQPGKPVEMRLSSSSGFLVDRVSDGSSEQDLEREPWTHVILQAQKYSTTGSLSYPTDAAEYWIRGSKEQGATPIMFPEHPRRGNTWEGRTLWELHTGIAMRENTCVAPVGPVWDEVIFRAPSLVLHQPDGNHASQTGALLTALVFYPIITGQPVESLPELSAFGIDAETEQVMKESVSAMLYIHPPCNFEPGSF